MNNLKTKMVIACLSIVSASFAVDEYLPIGPGAWEVDVGYAATKGTGRFDSNGDKVDIATDPMTNAVPLQIKYGVMAGMDLELLVPIVSQNSDAGGKSGVDRPELALKYSHPDWKTFGGYLNLVLPVGLADFSKDPAPGTALGLGAVYADQYSPEYRMVGLASYQYSLPSGDNKNPDVFTLYVKPEYVWNAQAGTYLGVKFNYNGQKKFNGVELNNAGYLVTLLPGLNFKQDERISYEVNLPITILGETADATIGVAGSVYITL